MKELFVVEFSVNQQAFHKHTISEMLEVNIRTIFLRGKSDYLPIGIFNTSDDADKFIKEVYGKFKKRTKSII